MASEDEGMTYAKAGVDTTMQQAAVRALTHGVSFHRTGDGEPLGPSGAFAGLVRLGDRALALCTDGVGTKIEVANRVRDWTTIGIDAIAMNVNDCICVGAEPLAFVDYLAIAEPDRDVTAQIGQGLDAGARLANVTLAGGETAVMPEVINGLDLAGACVGIVDEDEIIDGSKLRPGGALVGLASSGLHSNGYTLARRILEDADVDLKDDAPGTGTTWAKALLEPTRIYVRPIMELLASVPVHGLANITGSGLKNVPRMNAKLRYEITDPLPVPPVFPALQQLGRVAEEEMLHTFNMGLGFVVAVAEQDAKRTVELLSAAGEHAAIVGRVASGTGCVHVPSGLEYEAKTNPA